MVFIMRGQRRMPCFSRTTWALILAICVHPTNMTHPSDEYDNMGKQDKAKLTILAEELLKDAKLQQRHIHAIRNSHKIFLSYDIGLILGKIREKYKRMMDIYREAHDRKTNRTKLIPPTVRDFKALHWIVSMELVHTMEVDIDKLIHALETIKKKALEHNSGQDVLGAINIPHADPDDQTTGDPSPSSGGAPPPAPSSGGDPASSPGGDPASSPGGDPGGPVLRTSNEPANNTVPELSQKPKFRNEDELKQHYREQYKVRSGRNTSWTLDEYYGLV